MNEARESAELDDATPELGAVYIRGTAFEQLVQVEERLQDGALAGAVCAEQERERREVDALTRRDAFKVLELKGVNHDLPLRV